MTPSRYCYIAAAVCFFISLIGVTAGIDLVTLGLLLIAVGLAL